MSPPDPAILIAEDEEPLAELFEMWLAESCDVQTVTNGRAALAALDESIDAVVLDWRMPDVTGAELVGAIRDRGLPCAVVVVTGFDPDFAGLADEVDAALTKPVSSDELRGAVLDAVGTPVVE